MVLAKTPDRIVDRKQEIRTLVSDLADSSKNVNYGLIGFRRIGKTTILQEVAKELTSKGLIVVSIDFSLRKYDPAGFFKDMLNETSRGYYRVAGKKEQVLDDVRAGLNKLKDLTRARVRLEISVDQTTGSPTITPMPYLKEAERDYSILFRSTFEYVSQIAERSGRRVYPGRGFELSVRKIGTARLRSGLPLYGWKLLRDYLERHSFGLVVEIGD